MEGFASTEELLLSCLFCKVCDLALASHYLNNAEKCRNKFRPCLGLPIP